MSYTTERRTRARMARAGRGGPRAVAIRSGALSALASALVLIVLTVSAPTASAHFTPSTLSCSGARLSSAVSCQMTIVPTHLVHAGERIFVSMTQGVNAPLRITPAGVGVIPGGTCGSTGGGPSGEGPVVEASSDLDFAILLDRVSCPPGGTIVVNQSLSRVLTLGGATQVEQTVSSDGILFGPMHQTPLVAPIQELPTLIDPNRPSPPRVCRPICPP